tara:strand:+ start:845 stop:1168 length:324 start_codon:yes stop_codon:yes gene_type:complete
MKLESLIPGELFPEEGEIELNEGRPVTTISVSNQGDRPIQVGSHFHFYETNKALIFERQKALGKRLDIPAGTAIRFEPGDSRQVRLIPFAGNQKIFGFNGLINGSIN